ncbi:MAG: glycosyltransferase family 4 protein [bacterium]|nr:glycosyltransferase family 4 protein [bacterium]
MYVGDPRELKGFSLISDICATVLREHSEVRLVVQRNMAGTSAIGPDSDEILDKSSQSLQLLAGRDTRLHLINGFLSPSAYSDVIETSDLIVLPYYPNAYRTNPAGPAVDALSLGRPVVVPAETESARQLAEFGNPGLTFNDFSAASVAEAVGRAIADLDRLRHRAKAAMPRLRQAHGNEKFIDALFGRGSR